MTDSLVQGTTYCGPSSQVGYLLQWPDKIGLIVHKTLNNAYYEHSVEIRGGGHPNLTKCQR